MKSIYIKIIMLLLFANNVEARIYYSNNSISQIGTQAGKLGYLDLIQVMLMIISIILIAKIAMRYTNNNTNNKKNLIELMISILLLLFGFFYINIIIDIIYFIK